MITANEARTIANDVMTARDNQLKLDAVDWVEKYAAPRIEEAYKDGRFHVFLTVREVQIQYVQDYLENNGYSSSVFNENRLQINW